MRCFYSNLHKAPSLPCAPPGCSSFLPFPFPLHLHSFFWLYISHLSYPYLTCSHLCPLSNHLPNITHLPVSIYNLPGFVPSHLSAIFLLPTTISLKKGQDPKHPLSRLTRECCLTHRVIPNLCVFFW